MLRTCPPRLLAGFFDMFNTQSHAGKEPFIGLYRQRVLAFHGVKYEAPPTQHLLLLVRKQGRRGIHNFDQTLAYLRKSCDGLCRGLGRTRPVESSPPPSPPPSPVPPPTFTSTPPPHLHQAARSESNPHPHHHQAARSRLPSTS